MRLSLIGLKGHFTMWSGNKAAGTKSGQEQQDNATVVNHAETEITLTGHNRQNKTNCVFASSQQIQHDNIKTWSNKMSVQQNIHHILL